MTIKIIHSICMYGMYVCMSSFHFLDNRASDRLHTWWPYCRGPKEVQGGVWSCLDAQGSRESCKWASNTGGHAISPFLDGFECFLNGHCTRSRGIVCLTHLLWHMSAVTVMRYLLGPCATFWIRIRQTRFSDTHFNRVRNALLERLLYPGRSLRVDAWSLSFQFCSRCLCRLLLLLLLLLLWFRWRQS